MRSVAIVLLAMAACFSKPPRPGTGDATVPTDSPEGWLGDFAFRKPITITASASETLAEFPVGVSITDPDLAANAKSDGRDIVVTSDDGTTVIPSEVASYENGKLELWIRIAALADTSTVFMYYGGKSQTSDTVWSDATFAGVWHLSETGPAKDSAADNDLNGTGSETPEPFPDGVFGSARALDGNDKILGGDPSNDSLDFASTSFSYSVWVHQTALGAGDFDTPFLKGGLSGNEAGYCLLLGDLWTAKISDGAQHIADPEFGAAILNDWAHLTTVVDRSVNTMTVYVDGVVKDSKSIADVGSVSNAASIQIGRGTIEPFLGRLDELRIYKTALTPAWIGAEFRNGRDPNFLTFGAEQAKP